MEQILITVLTMVNEIIGVLFFLFYLHQFIYIPISLFRKPLTYPKTDQSKRYAVLIAARNEETCLPQLLESIRRQTYPQSKITVYVAADSCTDRTAELAREAGAIVYERNDPLHIGKGYVLDFLLQSIRAEKGSMDYYDAYLVFDADNILKQDYIEQMDRCYCAGYRIITSYRNSKNFGKNWISAGQALWFIREAHGLNNARSIIGSSAALSGTGFLVAGEIFEREGGWNCHLLIEDIEFTTKQVLEGEKIGYCNDAMFYDEQPTKFSQSWRQRIRWSKGFFQVFRDYYPRLFRGVFHGSYSCYDMLTSMAPAFLLTAAMLLSNFVILVLSYILCGYLTFSMFTPFLSYFCYTYLLFFILGASTLIGEWKSIGCSTLKKILYLFTFPLFMFTFLPCAIVAMFSKASWKPIEHTESDNLDELVGKKEEK